MFHAYRLVLMLKTSHSRGQRAAQPDAGYQHPSATDASGLIVTIVLPDGSQRTYDFSDLMPVTPLLQSLVTGFARASGSGGRWPSVSSMRTGQATLRRLYRFVSDLDSAPQTIEDVSPRVWRAWQDHVSAKSVWPGVLSNCRALLQSTPGVPVETLEATRQRLPKPRARTKLRAMSRDEFRRTKRAAWPVLRGAVERVRANQARLTTALRLLRSQDTDEARQSARSLEQFAVYGALPASKLGMERLKAVFGDEDLRFCFHIHAVEAYAGMLLLTALRGYNPTTLYRLKAGHQRPDGGVDGVAVVNIETRKDRRGASRAVSRDNLVRTSGLSAALVYELVREVTEPTRRALKGAERATDLLFVARSRRADSGSPLQILTGEAIPCGAKRSDLASRLDVTGDNGLPVEVTLQRLRLTEQVINRNPRQNSSATHDRIYVLPERSIDEEAAQTIRAGQSEAVDHARALFHIRALSPTERKAGQADPDRLAAILGIKRERLTLLLAGQLDTPVAACKDFDHSPLSEGGTCRVSFLHCFACSNAIAAPEHLPRLVYLHDALTSISTAVSLETWISDYRDAFDRLDQLLTGTFSAAERTAARARVTLGEREGIEALLRRKFDA